MDHSPGFLKLVQEAQTQVQEITIAEARERLAQNPQAVLIDVREDSEWLQGHAAEAVHLGRGILERDLEKAFPNPGTELLLYCGGGFRSVLAALNAGKMGYSKVFSIHGGYKGMVQSQWPVKAGDQP